MVIPVGPQWAGQVGDHHGWDSGSGQTIRLAVRLLLHSATGRGQRATGLYTSPAVFTIVLPLANADMAGSNICYQRERVGTEGLGVRRSGFGPAS